MKNYKVAYEFGEPGILLLQIRLTPREYIEIKQKGTLIGRNINLANEDVPENFKCYTLQVWISKGD